MITYSFVITVINLAGIVLLVGLVTWQGILIRRQEEVIGVLYENQVKLADAVNGLILEKNLKTQFTTSENGL